MPPVPDSSSIVNPNVEAGLLALKQGDYKTAIAQLEAAPLPSHHPLTAKAQMGLAVAYTRVGEPLRAAALCQTLRQSENLQVSEWATRTLASLAKRHPQVDQSEADRAIGTAATQPASVPDLTGFTPFDPAAPPDFPVDRRSDTLDAGALPQQHLEPQPLDSQPLDLQQPDSQPLDSQRPDSQRVDARSQSPPAVGMLEGTTWIASKGTSAARASGKARSQTPPTGSKTAQPLTLDEPPFYQATWRQAGRLKQGKTLGKVKLVRLLLLQVGTAIALFWMVQAIAYNTALYYGIALTKIPFLGLSRELFHPSVGPILVFLGLLFVASRWLLDGLLTIGYGLQPLSLNKLGTYSPETAQSLQRFCRQQRIPMPTLGILPTTAPIAFSYGCLPHVTRTVVSQGLLEQLADDEIATVYASEVGHIARFNVPLLSLVMVLMQIPYTLYWQISEWGDRKQAAVSRVSASVLGAIAYGIYALLRWIGLWLSRQRVYYSDRVAAELTGNPNGFTRALLKIAIGTAKEVQTQKQTSYLLEGFDLLTPLGQRMATTLGSVYPHAPIESVLEWERTNPYRNWLAMNNSHPPTGDRLNLLTLYARHWNLDTELQWGNRSTVSNQPKSSLTAHQWRSLLLQGAPFFGLAFGAATAYLFAALGWIGWRTGIEQLSWMYGDHALLLGLPLVGFSIGTFMRINPLFPDVPFANTKPIGSSDSLVALLKPADRLPLASQTVQLEGTLLGRAAIGNLLSQDLLLQTATGIVRLHSLSSWGPVGNLLPLAIRPTDLLHQNVAITGWFRHGATPWIDVETIRTAGGRVSRSGHPVWSTILGAIASAWGIYTIFRGGIF